MTGMAPPPPPPLAAARPARDFLAADVTRVFHRVPGKRPMASYAPARGGAPDGHALLHDLASTGDAVMPVSFAIAQRLLSAIASLPLGADAAGTFARSITIRQFREMTQQQQTAFINGIWNLCTNAYPFGQPTALMDEPNNNVIAGNGPLPTSIIPDGLGGYRKRLPAPDQPFRTLGIGFRTEGSTARALAHGFTQQRLNTAFMHGAHRGLNVEQTVIADTTTARFWTGNNDIFNETAVCVSRNFFGGTAFPERTTNALCFLFAVDCSGLLGFDTERAQTQMPNSRQWRPGEKAYGAIPATSILGYIPIQRRGAPAGGGWRFQIEEDTAWTITGSPSVQQRIYLEEELAAWRGSHEIPPEFDFAVPA